MELGGREFGSWEAAHQEFLKSLPAYGHRRQGVIRFIGMGAKIHVSFVRTGTCMFGGRKARLYLLLDVAENDVNTSEGPTKIFGPMRLNLQSETIYYRRDLIPMSPIEFRLVEFLCSKPGKICSKEEITKQVWRQRALNTRAVDICVSRIRRRLGYFGVPKEVITTVRGRGYMFRSEVMVDA